MSDLFYQARNNNKRFNHAVILNILILFQCDYNIVKLKLAYMAINSSYVAIALMLNVVCYINC